MEGLMKNIFQIFRRDIKRIAGNWVAVIVIIGVALIPSLYAWFNIAANMDPYSHTQEIHIAVTSCDVGTRNKMTGYINAGDSIIDNLKKNDALGWTFVDEKEAIEGVRAGNYYAAIVIPEDFSKSLVSVLSGKIESPVIQYYLNEKKNAIAPKVTDTGASAIQREVNETFVSVASEAITEMLEQSAGSAQEDIDKLRRNSIADIRQARESLSGQRMLLSRIRRTAKGTGPLIKTGRDTLQELSVTTGRSADSLEKTVKLTEELRSSASRLTLMADSTLSQMETTMNRVDMATGESMAALHQQTLKVNGTVAEVLASARKASEASKQITEELERIQQQYPGGELTAVSTIIEKRKAEDAELIALIGRLEQVNRQFADTSTAMTSVWGNMSKTVATGRENLRTVRERYSTEVLPGLNRSLDMAALHATQISGTLAGMEPVISQMETILDQMESGLTHTVQVVGAASELLGQADSKLAGVETDLLSLKNAREYQRLEAFLKGDGWESEDISGFISSPVGMSTESCYPVNNYGSAMTPFYTNLAIWVSGIVLIAIFKMEVDRDKKLQDLTVTQAYFGRWMLFIAMGLVQAVIVCLGDIWLLRVQCENIPAFLAAGMFISFVYINLIYALAITFKHIGKALCVLLVILQIPGSAGTYPIEMTPNFFQRLHPLLPFTYGVNAMREAAFGMYENDYWKYMGCLALFLPIAFLIGLGIRPLMLNLNRMFDKRLEETGLMICEEEGMTMERLKLSTAINIIAGQEDFKKIILEKEEKFQRAYPKRKKRGFLLIVVLPLVFLVLMFSVSSKMVFLVLWIASIVAVILYLIILEYIYENLQRKLRLAGESKEQILNCVKKGSKQ